MIKTNYKLPDELETAEDIALHNIMICDKFKHSTFLELSCLAWLKNDASRNYQDLEELLRLMDLDAYIIACPISNIPQGFEINKPNKQNDTNCKIDTFNYFSKITCMNKDDSLKELLKYHKSYEENFKYLCQTGCLMTVKDEKILNVDDVPDTFEKKILNSKLKLDLEIYKPIDSINYIINDLTNKYGKKPEKIICGEINTNKVWTLMLNNEIISSIGWIEKNINDEIEYELIDFRKIKIEK